MHENWQLIREMDNFYKVIIWILCVEKQNNYLLWSRIQFIIYCEVAFNSLLVVCIIFLIWWSSPTDFWYPNGNFCFCKFMHHLLKLSISFNDNYFTFTIGVRTINIELFYYSFHKFDVHCGRHHLGLLRILHLRISFNNNYLTFLISTIGG